MKLEQNNQHVEVDNSPSPISFSLPSAFACLSVMGKLVNINAQGIPQVQYQDGTGNIQTNARFTIPLHSSHIGSDVVLLLTPNNKLSTQQEKPANPDLPVIIGIIQSALSEFISKPNQALTQQKNQASVMVNSQNAKPINAQIDGQSVIIRAENNITLECGEARITLQKDGKIKIKGNYVISQAKKANCIRGGSVELN